MTQTVRAYAGKDVDMLTACSTIIDQAIAHKTFLISKRANWADPFFPNLKIRIDNAFTNFLGMDSAQAMREATQVMAGVQKKALSDLADFKVQIMEDFKNNKIRRDEIFTRLGFAALLKDVQKNDLQALVELLLSFKQNMTTALQTEITTAGTSAALITTLKGYADVLKNANITQETLKGSRRVISATSVAEFNAIYNAVISVAKISAKFYKADKAMQAKFSYSKTANAISLTIAKKAETPPAK